MMISPSWSESLNAPPLNDFVEEVADQGFLPKNAPYPGTTDTAPTTLKAFSVRNVTGAVESHIAYRSSTIRSALA